MEILYAICCGLDVHKDSITACLRRLGGGGHVTQELRPFGTTTGELLALLDWLVAAGCTHVAMESTGVYWKPVFNILEGHFQQVLVVNAQHIKALPGRKKDTLDAEWIAQLLQHGLLRGSFIPPAPIRDLREATRYRKQLIRLRADETNRIQKLLEGANLKLGSVATDILGVSGRAMLAALVHGETDAAALAGLAKGRLRKKQPQLVAALTGRITPVQRTLLGQQLAHVEDPRPRHCRAGCPDRHAHGPLPGGGRAAPEHPGDRHAEHGEPHRRTRGRHDGLPLGRPLRLLGRDVSRPQ
jgi:transposase